MINSTPAPPHTSLEETLIQVSDILRCASAAAYESGDALNARNATWHSRWSI